MATTRRLDGDEWDSSLTVEGYSDPERGNPAQGYMDKICPDYFTTLGVPMISGRAFTASDDHPLKPGEDLDAASRVAIINESFARRYFAGRDPWAVTSALAAEITGVVKDFKYTGLGDDIPDQVFLPYPETGFTGQSEMAIYVRTAGDPASVNRCRFHCSFRIWVILPVPFPSSLLAWDSVSAGGLLNSARSADPLQLSSQNAANAFRRKIDKNIQIGIPRLQLESCSWVMRMNRDPGGIGCEGPWIHAGTKPVSTSPV